MGSSKRKQSLRAKLSLGWSVKDAAEQLGIPLEDAEKEAKEILQKTSEDDAGLHLLAFDAIRTGIEKLKEISAEGYRVSSTGLGGEKLESVDLVAAKALVDSGIKIRSLIGKTKEKAAELEAGQGAKKSQPDLWDLYGPWRLKKPEDG